MRYVDFTDDACPSAPSSAAPPSADWRSTRNSQPTDTFLLASSALAALSLSYAMLPPAETAASARGLS